MLVLGCLAVVWAFLLVPPMLRKHREGRPASSVVSFRRQLSTLERATPGTSLRPLPAYRPQPVGTSSSAQMSRVEVQRRRKNVLIGLLGATGFTFLLVLAATSALTVLLFLGTAGALGAYVYALVQLRMRAEEASTKVRVLRPQAAPAPAAAAMARRTASN